MEESVDAERVSGGEGEGRGGAAVSDRGRVGSGGGGGTVSIKKPRLREAGAQKEGSLKTLRWLSAEKLSSC